jgi:hypothetical protein
VVQVRAPGELYYGLHDEDRRQSQVGHAIDSRHASVYRLSRLTSRRKGRRGRLNLGWLP